MKNFMKIAAALCMLSACQFGWAMESKETKPQSDSTGLIKYQVNGKTITAQAVDIQTNKKTIEPYIELLKNKSSWGEPTISLSSTNRHVLLQYPNGVKKYLITYRSETWEKVDIDYSLLVFKNLPPCLIIEFFDNNELITNLWLIDSLPSELIPLLNTIQNALQSDYEILSPSDLSGVACTRLLFRAACDVIFGTKLDSKQDNVF